MGFTSMKFALEAELESINRQIAACNKKREAILHLLDVYGLGGESATLSSAVAALAGSSQAKCLNTMEMARVVIRNAGKPLKPEAIREGIKSTFGIEPAKTLPDMLWKYARAARGGFFRQETGEIGLDEMQPKIETVGHEQMAESAVA